MEIVQAMALANAKAIFLMQDAESERKCFMAQVMRLSTTASVEIGIVLVAREFLSESQLSRP